MAAVRRKHRIVAGIAFVLYLVVLFYFLFFAEGMGRTGTGSGYRYNLKPFAEITRFIRYKEVLGTSLVLLNIVGNVVAFLPFGTFAPIFAVRAKNFWCTALYSFELSLLVELLQLLFKVGCFDVDDLLLNTLGGILGYLVYRLLRYFDAKRKKWQGSK